MAKLLFGGLAILGMILSATDCPCQVLTLEDVQGLDWSGSTPAKLKTATDGVFDEGPDYWYQDEDEWFNESDVVTDCWDFTISIYNNSQQPVDDVMMLIAYREGEPGAIHVGGWTATPADFYDNVQPPFGPAGNRPGDGETALYNGATGVVFIRIGAGIAARDTLSFPVVVDTVRAVLDIHFDAYGLRVPSRQGDVTTCAAKSVANVVVSTNAASHDITWDAPSVPASTHPDTWGRLKSLFTR